MVSRFSALGPKPSWKIAPLPLRTVSRLQCLYAVRTTSQDVSLVLTRGGWTCRPGHCGLVINTPQLSQDVGSQNKSDEKHPQAQKVTLLSQGHERVKNFPWLQNTVIPDGIATKPVWGEHGLYLIISSLQASRCGSRCMSWAISPHSQTQHKIFVWSLSTLCPLSHYHPESGTGRRIYFRQKHFVLLLFSHLNLGQELG